MRRAVAAATGWGIQAERVARAAVRRGPRRRGVHAQVGGRGPSLVLLNGIGASGLLWPRAWVDQLERTHHVIRPDARGTGGSSGAVEPFTVADLADDVAAVLDRADVATATVLGLSMGGMVAAELALRHRERVERLVLVSTIPPAPAHVPTAFYGPLYGPMARLAAGYLGGGRRARAELLARFYLRTCSPAFVPDAALVDELADQLAVTGTPVAGVAAQARAVVAWRGPERLTRIDRPTTVIAGRDDPVVKPRNGRRLAALVPGADCLELAGVGHLVPWEAPEALLGVLRS
ncbi:alpha/beta hydrolase [Actinomycetospora endophytica]|uniref:Alpha/beta hydrolase n=1 Tax=Actinomycetospora endophytica TaxID=2291215 RepID=A0ABS8PHB9_9PSEU|nr:alpha/beta hydrolase [Actinomycetospora endophytica]MCD2197650.1 alpha/beta hydrolase [Actinomycetospora endophytica]